jgi:hypothetical protein
LSESWWNGPQTDETGLKSLRAYFVSNRGLMVAELRAYLEKTLPDYMIPAVFIPVDRIPQTPNGKVDRSALPKGEPYRFNLGIAYLSPQTEIEHQLAGIWREILKCDRVGTQDNFFTLGGNSLLIVLMHNRINNIYPGKIEITDIFAYPTIAKLAQFIESGVEVNPVQLDELPFPGDYFGVTDESEFVFKFQIDGQRFTRLKMAANLSGLSLKEILLAAYCYLLMEISEQQNIVVQTVLSDTAQVFPLKVDFGELSDLLGLLQTIKQKLANVSRTTIYDIQQLNKFSISKGKSNIIPFFADGYDLTLQTLAHYDLLFNIKSITAEQVTFTCSFNQQRLKRQAVEQLINAYRKLIVIILERMEC